MPEGFAQFAEVHLAQFNDDTDERLYVVEFYDMSYDHVKNEYYKDKAAAYRAAAEVNEKK